MIQGAALAYRTRYSRICPVDNAIALKNALRPLEPYLELTGTNEVIVNRENEVVLETASGWEFVPDGNITKEMFLSVGRILANRAVRGASSERRKRLSYSKKNGGVSPSACNDTGAKVGETVFLSLDGGN